jgi:hypothetical protein
MLRLLMIGLIFAPAASADEKNQFALEAPADWGGETIKLPPGFARDMKWRGVEHIRFAPGMMQANSDTFFCYAFAFELDRNTDLTQEAVTAEFLKYYRGLCSAVAGAKIPDLDTSKFSFKLEPTKTKPTALADVKEIHYTGVLDWIEPFATRKPQKLNVEIQTWKDDHHGYLFAGVSPQATDAVIWNQLHKIRDDYVSKSK